VNLKGKQYADLLGLLQVTQTVILAAWIINGIYTCSNSE